MASLLSYTTAKWLAPASFAYDFLAQQYGLAIANPTMKQVHDRNLSFFSPQPYFIGGFFFPQQIIQCIWLYRLWKLNPKKSAVEKKELDTIVDFVPFYALGNICIGTWMFFWNAEKLKAANIFVIINTFSQLYYVSRMARLNTNSLSSVLTHITAKTFLGIGVLDILHNTSIAYYKDQAPSTLIKVLTGVGFGVGAAMSDWIVGGCLVYDLIALACGQSGSWSMLLGAYAVGAAAIVGAKNYAIPPYEKKPVEYETTPSDDGFDQV